MTKRLSNFSFGEVLNRKAQISITGGGGITGITTGVGTSCSIICPGTIFEHKISCSTSCTGSNNCIRCSGNPASEFCCVNA